MAHTEMSTVSIASLGPSSWPGVGDEVVPTEGSLSVLGTEERTGLWHPALPDVSQLNVLSVETRRLEEPADVLIVLVI